MNIIKKPILTEKSFNEYKKSNKVTFEVDLSTNKIQASKTLEQIYSVKVVSVNVNSRLGKHKYNRLSKRFSQTSPKKIMTFVLDKSNKLDIFETK